MEMENLYLAPEVEILEVEVERGYTMSAGGADEDIEGL